MTIKIVSDKLNGCIDFEVEVNTYSISGIVHTDVALYDDGTVNINEDESPNHDAWLNVEDMRTIVATYDKLFKGCKIDE